MLNWHSQMCRSSASFRIDEWQSFSIITDTVLMWTSVTTVLGVPPTYSNSADYAVSKCFKPSANSPAKFHFGKLLPTEQSFPLLIFLSRTKFCSTTLFGQTIHFLVYTVTHCLEPHIISTCAIAMHFFFIVNEEDISPLTFPMLPKVERSFHFYVCFFLHPSFSTGVCTTVFTKPAIIQYLIDVHMPAGACWKDNELHNTFALLEF